MCVAVLIPTPRGLFAAEINPSTPLIGRMVDQDQFIKAIKFEVRRRKGGAMGGFTESWAGDSRAELEAQGLFEAVSFKHHDITENVTTRPVNDDPSGVEQDCARTEL